MAVASYQKYDILCDRERAKNAVLLREFATWLQEKGLAQKTIGQHVGNVGFYVDDFLLSNEDIVPAAKGAPDMCGFLGHWFIRKAMWASEATIRGNAASLKKFYTFMVARDRTSQEDLDMLKESMREDMPEWLATFRRYDDPNITDPWEVWGLK